jgi:hypothetical protein
MLALLLIALGGRLSFANTYQFSSSQAVKLVGTYWFAVGSSQKVIAATFADPGSTSTTDPLSGTASFQLLIAPGTNLNGAVLSLATMADVLTASVVTYGKPGPPAEGPSFAAGAPTLNVVRISASNAGAYTVGANSATLDLLHITGANGINYASDILAGHPLTISLSGSVQLNQTTPLSAGKKLSGWKNVTQVYTITQQLEAQAQLQVDYMETPEPPGLALAIGGCLILVVRLSVRMREWGSRKESTGTPDDAKTSASKE